MPRLNAANNARTILVQAVGTADTTIYVQSVSAFPAPPFRVTVDNEIMEVTAVDTNLKSFTVERAKEGTVAASHSIGTVVENRWTAGTYDELATQVALDVHLADNMPHLAVDPTTNKTYRWGLAIQDGRWGLLYEEVV